MRYFRYKQSKDSLALEREFERRRAKSDKEWGKLRRKQIFRCWVNVATFLFLLASGIVVAVFVTNESLFSVLLSAASIALGVVLAFSSVFLSTKLFSFPVLPESSVFVRREVC